MHRMHLHSEMHVLANCLLFFFGDSLFVDNIGVQFIYYYFIVSIVFLLLHFTVSAWLMLQCGSPLSPGRDVGRGVSEQSACTS